LDVKKDVTLILSNSLHAKMPMRTKLLCVLTQKLSSILPITPFKLKLEARACSFKMKMSGATKKYKITLRGETKAQAVATLYS